MPLHKNVLIMYSIEKADQALRTAFDNIDKDLITVNNRIYYAAFYIVVALAYLNDFVTGSHHNLMGWFNKKYIYENSIFDANLSKIYSQLLRNREKFDYDVAEFPDHDTSLENFEKAKLFVESVKAYILENIQEDNE